MGKALKAVFGGTDKSSLKAQRQSNKRDLGFIQQQGANARSDVLPLAGSAFENQNLGNQAALDVYGQTIPQQLSTFQGGNVGAQNSLLAGMPQFQNAILGMPVDYSQFQPQALQYDPSYAQQQLPDFINPSGLVPEQHQQAGFRPLQDVAQRGYTGMQTTPDGVPIPGYISDPKSGGGGNGLAGFINPLGLDPKGFLY